MRSILLFCLLCIASCSTPPDKRLVANVSDNSKFDEEAFAMRCSLATSLMYDDSAAWKTSDYITSNFSASVLDSLDETWFVVPENVSRTVFYGKFLSASKSYQPKFQFSVTPDSGIRHIPPALSSEILVYAKAVYTGTTQFKKLLDSLMLNFSFNHYIRKNSDASFTMWFFPAGMDTYCPYGLEAQLSIDQTGSIVKNITLTGNELKYFEVTKKPDSILLDNTFEPIPTVGNIFFILMFGKYFTSVEIQNAFYQTSATWSPEHNTWNWTHTANALLHKE